MKPTGVWVPYGTSQTEIEVRKSRFAGRAGRVRDPDAAMDFLADAKRRFPGATHHCWAYVCVSAEHASGVALSDDGEPTGTAGKPILNVLRHKGVREVMVVVARYFGGIKLGTGGLVRAYSRTAQETMNALQLKAHVATSQARVELEFGQEQALRHWLSQHHGRIERVDYGARVIGIVSFASDQAGVLREVAKSRGWWIEMDRDR